MKEQTGHLFVRHGIPEILLDFIGQGYCRDADQDALVNACKCLAILCQVESEKALIRKGHGLTYFAVVLEKYPENVELREYGALFMKDMLAVE